MAIIILLIVISLSIAILFLVIFYWNMRSGQYDDTYTPSVRMLFDNKPGPETSTKRQGRKAQMLKEEPGKRDAQHT